jgi:hypothetical protein
MSMLLELHKPVPFFFCSFFDSNVFSTSSLLPHSCSVLFSSKRMLMFCLDYATFRIARTSNVMFYYTPYFDLTSIYSFFGALACWTFFKRALAQAQRIILIITCWMHAYTRQQQQLLDTFFSSRIWSNEIEMIKWEPTGSLRSNNCFWIIQSSW